MATTTTTTSLTPPSLSSLPLFHPTPQLLRLPFLFSLSSPISLSPKYPLLRLPCTPTDDVSPVPPEDEENEDEDEDEDDASASFDPSQLASYTPTPYFDEGPEETEEQVAAGYEELYGPAYSSKSVLGGDIYIMDKKKGPRAKPGRRQRDGLEERVLEIRRVQKVVKGGRKLSFRVVVICGDKQGHVGVGVAQAKDSMGAVHKAIADARKNIITVPMTKHSTFPHRADGKFGAATVMLRPASPGSGVSAGGTVRLVLELAGVLNALGKQLGSGNAMNNARAAIVAMKSMRLHSDVAAERGIPVEEFWK